MVGGMTDTKDNLPGEAELAALLAGATAAERCA